MRLWTYQNHALDITDGAMCIDSLKYSEYLNSVLADSKEWRKTYEQLSRELGTSDILWCHTGEDEAKHYGEHVRGNYDLWELEIDDARRHWKVCSMAWHWILVQGTTLPPSQFDWIFATLARHISDYSRETFWEDFNLAWRQEPLARRWEMLFYRGKDIVPGCMHVLLPHPVEASCVVARTPVSQMMLCRVR